MNTGIKVRFKQWECDLNTAFYPNKRKALYLTDSKNGENIATCSINLINEFLEDGFIHIKEWSENEGMTEALMKADVIEKEMSLIPVGPYGSFATLCKLKI